MSILKILKMVLMFATPLFVFMSEFLISYSYSDNIPNNFLKKRFKFIFMPFLSMAIIYGIASYFSNDITDKEIISTILANVFLGNFMGYFILIIFQFYILHLLFSKYLKNVKAKYILLISFVINLTYLGFFNFTPPLNIPFSEYIWERFYWIPFLGWLFYFTLGYYIGRKYEYIKSKLVKFKIAIFILTIISATVVLICSFLNIFPDLSSKRIDVMVYTSFMIISLILVFSKMKKVPKIVHLVSGYSFSIYLLHPIILDFITAITIRYNFPEILKGILPFSIFLFLSALLFSIFIAHIINMHKYGYMIVGKINSSRKTRIEAEAKVS